MTGQARLTREADVTADAAQAPRWARVTALLPGADRLTELSAECFGWQAELLHDASPA